MKSDIIRIDNQGNGFQDAIAETRRVAVYQELNAQASIRLQLITEEMLSLARSVTGEMQASFWIEGEKQRFELHMTTQTVMDKEKRYQLLSAATSRRNEAARTFLGFLRDAFEEAMASEVMHAGDDLPADILADLTYRTFEDPEWDGYERSVLRKLTDDVKIAIRGNIVDMVVTKDFGKMG